MKLENNWKYKTLENLEKRKSPEPPYISNLVRKCSELDKKQLIEFSTEDLRLMINQSFSLNYLIPLAIEKLEENILAEGHLYEGDLLNAVLTSDMNYWKREKMNYEIVHKLFDKNQEKVKDSNLGKDLFKSYKEFKKLD
ncbi:MULTISPECIES: contact-dependent growth inhibition system immunity protein [Mesonia]|uniref:Uncharacterized protein n=1 Tax=Mesonia oceanica TaxID=2687242 RepID=A0AC61YDY0_9FLAO|nr:MULTISPECIES: contact-dependent growth inhibition system immunity protein [Mesonia]MAN27192.1 hypothetical protein [Mesonia sp.]MAQ41924.1 hypothetical protein [Mesonia sp.]VVV02595.1 hypothetical protein FVB9532_03902 [Mesonia oceanica]|tara:strand:+ start:1510 stop:1926 length:417 start_codon:yes stop_codon:yes gene_type:complete